MHLIKPGQQEGLIAWEVQSCEHSVIMHVCFFNDLMVQPVLT